MCLHTCTFWHVLSFPNIYHLIEKVLLLKTALRQCKVKQNAENGIVLDDVYRRCCYFGDNMIGRTTTIESMFPDFNR